MTYKLKTAPKFCEICGRKLGWKNKVGICKHCTPENLCVDCGEECTSVRCQPCQWKRQPEFLLNLRKVKTI
jgi:hypothetical protein